MPVNGALRIAPLDGESFEVTFSLHSSPRAGEVMKPLRFCSRSALETFLRDGIGLNATVQERLLIQLDLEDRCNLGEILLTDRQRSLFAGE
jgi:hypothetical protein